MTTFLELHEMMNEISREYQRRGGYPKQYGRRFDYPHTYVASHYGNYKGFLDRQQFYEREKFVREKLTEIEVQHRRLGLSREQFSVVRQYTLALLRSSFLKQLGQLNRIRKFKELTYEEIVENLSKKGDNPTPLQRFLDDLTKGKKRRGC